jgi:hypothetical protein
MVVVYTPKIVGTNNNLMQAAKLFNSTFFQLVTIGGGEHFIVPRSSLRQAITSNSTVK